MSKIFYDHLSDMSHIEKRIKKFAKTEGERHELFKLVDDIMHHKVMTKVLDELPSEHHPEFLDKFSKHPHDHRLLEYLGAKIAGDVVALIKAEINFVAEEIIHILDQKAEAAISKKK